VQRRLEELQAETQYLQQQQSQQQMAATTTLTEARSELEAAQVRAHGILLLAPH
jgi:hypothetical protein